ncbi:MULTISPECIES: YggS family pyridoxal phosphate-dependent enzyme [Derxia]|uniref:Pyridoxal phosphate homeostasis protein n=1 Tax=Derxia gummosa DSM 723 TaxID=1121388 RepID=A0A8B6X8S4_9BURK|nr:MULTISPECIES: YggS family pyridoxal phosphate-dependent enzyme [Derxia]
MLSIFQQWQDTGNRVKQAALAAGREPSDVMILAVSKTQPAESVIEAWRAGAHGFGENYVQEAESKIVTVRRLLADEIGHRLPGNSAIPAGIGAPQWHFIGPLQSNKTRTVAELFDWVHSVERLKIAERLSAQRPAGLAPLQLCVQVNVSGEASKSGAAPAEAGELCLAVARLPNVELRGLMAIPEPEADPARQHRPFAALRALAGDIRARLAVELPEAAARFDQLSMGMSGDLEAAIAEGATIVRVGTAIFGARAAKAAPGA